MTLIDANPVTVLQVQEMLPEGTRINVFETIYWVFLVLGTLVGVVVIGYMVYNAWKYRADGTRDGTDEDRPQLGELPEGGGKGRKLFLSFTLSAIIVISLVVWTYAWLLYVEQGASAENDVVRDGNETDPVVIDVTGEQFSWIYEYPDGHTTRTLTVPKDRQVLLRVTSSDTIHTFGIPAFRVKTDAIKGEVADTWFVADETGNYTAKCYELCGSGHSYMTSRVHVVTQAEYEQWAATRGESESEESENETMTNETANATAAVAPVEVAS